MSQTPNNSFKSTPESPRRSTQVLGAMTKICRPSTIVTLIGASTTWTCTAEALEAPSEELLDQAAYAVLEYETSHMRRVFDGTWNFCVSVEDRDPSPYLLARFRSLYEHLTPASICKPDRAPRFDIHLAEVVEHNLKATFDCYEFCSYETTYTLELHAGNWLVTSARHKMAKVDEMTPNKSLKRNPENGMRIADAKPTPLSSTAKLGR